MANEQERTERAFDTRNTVKDEMPSKGTSSDDNLLDMDEGDAAKQMLKEWDQSWKAISRLAEQWKVNKARMDGFTGVQLVKKQDRMQAYIPTNAKKGVAGMNKAARLARRIRAEIFADEPEPEAMPGKDDDEARDAAEMATRVLQDLCAEGNLAYTLHSGDAFDLGAIYGSGFIRFWVDEQGGGWRPKRLLASPEAISEQDPFPVDPQTGVPKPVEPILRYVTENGEFTEQREQADRQWLPKIRDEVLSGKQIRFLPYDVRDLWEADAVQVGAAVTLGEFKRIFPEVKDWDDGRITKLVSNRPQRFTDILEPHQKDTLGQEVNDRSLVFVLTRYHVQSGTYPKGAYLIAAGADELMHRSVWFDEEHNLPLDIPITQFLQYTEEGNPYGKGVMTELGPGNEIRGSMLEGMLEHVRRFQSRKIFSPMTSPVQPQQYQSPTGTIIPILPGQEPKYEDIPDFPVIVEKMYGFVSTDMDDESGLQSAGQGLVHSNVKSGKHEELVLQQVAMGLSNLRHNVERGLIRGWRIMLQQIHAYYTVPQQISWEGDDGRYKQAHWSASDLGSTREVRIRRGTFTMMTPQAKAAQAAQFAQMGMLSPQDLEHVTEMSVSPMFGLQENPHRLRVRRQIAQWNDGPPEDFQPPPMMPQPQVPGQPPQPPPNPFAPLLAEIFAPVPADTEPIVAAIRTYELGRAMASTKFHRWKPEWQQGLAMAYQAARQAAQLPDAKMIQDLQQKLQQTGQELQAAKQKMAEAHVSFTGKLADLDEGQTQALLAKEGIQVPPRSRPVENGNGKPDPVLQMAHERDMHEADLAAEAHKTRIHETAETERTKIKEAIKAQTEERKSAREALMFKRMGNKSEKPQKAPQVTVTPQITVQIPASKGHKVVRDKDGKITGTEPNA